MRFQPTILKIAICSILLTNAAYAAKPSASFTVDKNTADAAPATINLDASGSIDDGTIEQYQWTTLAGQIQTGQTAQMTFDQAGTYPIVLTVTDDEGNTDSAQTTVIIGDNACEGHAVYTAETGQLQIPYVNIPTLPYIGGNHTPSAEKVAVVSLDLQLIKASNLFEIEQVKMIGETLNSSDPKKCHGIYTLNGELFLPFIDVPLVTILNGIPVPVGVETFEGKLSLLPFSDLFTINEVTPVGGSPTVTTGGGSGGGDIDPPPVCSTDEQQIAADAIGAMFLEPHTVFEAINDMMLVDYWSSGVWSKPITNSVHVPDMTFTASMTSGAPELSIIATMKDKTALQTELESLFASQGIETACIDDHIDTISGKEIRFIFDGSSSWSCTTDVPQEYLTLFPMQCSNQ